jgi:hypothetical protein
MSRLLSLLAGIVMALVPVTAHASPSPSPTLDGLFAPAPSGFVESTDSVVDETGPLDAATYAATFKGTQADVEKDLATVGFVAGYGRTWYNNPAQQFMVQEVIAFAGGRGAKGWLASTAVGARDDADYVRPDPITGIDPANGFHFHDSALKHPFGDEFDFVKGNDYFYVFIASVNDDGAALAAAQTTAQYVFAPPYTIPPSEWPETVSNSNAVTGRVVWLVLIVVSALAGLVIRSRRQRAAPAPAIGATLHLSPDGRYWWDGREWKDISQWVPPNVQRSADGAWWWDGSRWRPVPPLPKLF